MQAPGISEVARSRDLAQLVEKNKAYIRCAKAPATIRAY